MPPTVRPVRVAALQIAVDEDESPDSRWARVSALVRAQRGHDLVVLPELWAHGAFSSQSWADSAEPIDGPFVERIVDLARSTGITLHGGSLIESGPRRGPEGRWLWNTAVVADPSGRVTTYRKIHRFGFGDGEPVLLEAGTDLAVLPLAGLRTGLAICYDLRFPELFGRLTALGAEAFVVPASWPAARHEHWTLLGRARALENQAFVVQVNAVGTHGGIEMAGRSQIVAPTGEVLAAAGGTDEEALSVELDPREVAEFRNAFPVLADRRIAAPDTG